MKYFISAIFYSKKTGRVAGAIRDEISLETDGIETPVVEAWVQRHQESLAEESRHSDLKHWEEDYWCSVTCLTPMSISPMKEDC